MASTRVKTRATNSSIAKAGNNNKTALAPRTRRTRSAVTKTKKSTSKASINSLNGQNSDNFVSIMGHSIPIVGGELEDDGITSGAHFSACYGDDDHHRHSSTNGNNTANFVTDEKVMNSTTINLASLPINLTSPPSSDHPISSPVIKREPISSPTDFFFSSPSTSPFDTIQQQIQQQNQLLAQSQAQAFISSCTDAFYNNNNNNKTTTATNKTKETTNKSSVNNNNNNNNSSSTSTKQTKTAAASQQKKVTIDPATGKPKTTKRRPHNKSRHGCKTCKKRRVKCDETHPICNNCKHLSLECSFAGNSLFPFVQGGLNIMDIRLFHHYTTVVWKTIVSAGISNEEIWGRDVPEMAFEYPFLMHSILTFSANHFSRTQTALSDPAAMDQIVTYHRGDALKLLGEAVRNVTSKNLDALVASSILLILDSLANASPTETFSGSSLPASAWLHHVRGAAIILTAVGPPTPESRFFRLVNVDLSDLAQGLVSSIPGVEVYSQLECFDDDLQDLYPVSVSSPYYHALAYLDKLFRQRYKSDFILRVFSFPALLDRNLSTMLLEGDDWAKRIIRVYYRLVRSFILESRETVWFLEGVGKILPIDTDKEFGGLRFITQALPLNLPNVESLMETYLPQGSAGTSSVTNTTTTQSRSNNNNSSHDDTFGSGSNGEHDSANDDNDAMNNSVGSSSHTNNMNSVLQSPEASRGNSAIDITSSFSLQMLQDSGADLESLTNSFMMSSTTVGNEEKFGTAATTSHHAFSSPPSTPPIEKFDQIQIENTHHHHHNNTNNNNNNNGQIPTTLSINNQEVKLFLNNSGGSNEVFSPTNTNDLSSIGGSFDSVSNNNNNNRRDSKIINNNRHQQPQSHVQDWNVPTTSPIDEFSSALHPLDSTPFAPHQSNATRFEEATTGRNSSFSLPPTSPIITRHDNGNNNNNNSRGMDDMQGIEKSDDGNRELFNGQFTTSSGTIIPSLLSTSGTDLSSLNGTYR